MNTGVIADDPHQQHFAHWQKKRSCILRRGSRDPRLLQAESARDSHTQHAAGHSSGANVFDKVASVSARWREISALTLRAHSVYTENKANTLTELSCNKMRVQVQTIVPQVCFHHMLVKCVKSYQYTIFHAVV